MATILCAVVSIFEFRVRSRASLEVELIALRHQVTGRSHHDRPWQNGCAQRLIGSIRRDCLDHVVVFGEQHLRHLLNSYQKYYNEARAHLSLQKDTPIHRAVQTVGRTLAVPVLGGLRATNIYECEFPTGTMISHKPSLTKRMPARVIASAEAPAKTVPGWMPKSPGSLSLWKSARLPI
jgi:hypothetical protein